MDYYIMFALAVLGIADVWIERLTGKGWLERSIEFFDRRKA